MSHRKEETTEKYQKAGFAVPNPELMPYYEPIVLKESPDGNKRYIFSNTGEIALQLKRTDTESWESPFTLNLTGSKKIITVLMIPEDSQSKWGCRYHFYEKVSKPRVPGGWTLDELRPKELEARYQTLYNGGVYTDEVIPERLDFDTTMENFRNNYQQDIFYPPVLVAAA